MAIGNVAGKQSADLPSLNVIDDNEFLEPMDFIVKKAIATQLKSLAMNFSSSAVDELFELSSLFIHNLLHDLQKITNTQRRKQAAPKDLRLLLRDYHISIGELQDEYDRTSKLSKELLEHQLQVAKGAEKVVLEYDQQYELTPQDPSFVFFAQDQDLLKLIPPTNKKSKAIPQWLPEFPPDHTYRTSANYINRITGEKLVRQKIVEESRLGEKALERLINYNTANSNNKDIDNDDDMNNDDDGDDDDHTERDGHQENGSHPTEENTENSIGDIWSAGTAKKFDIEKYASARLRYLDKKAKVERIKREKIDYQYIKIVENLSSYGEDLNSDTQNSAAIYLESQLKNTLLSLKKLSSKRKKRNLKRQKLQKAKEEQAKLAKELNKEVTNFDDFENFGNFESFDSFGKIQELTELEIEGSIDIDGSNENNANSAIQAEEKQTEHDPDVTIRSEDGDSTPSLEIEGSHSTLLPISDIQHSSTVETTQVEDVDIEDIEFHDVI